MREGVWEYHDQKKEVKKTKKDVRENKNKNNKQCISRSCPCDSTCAGVILFDITDNGYNVLTVTGNYGFFPVGCPKGMIDLGENIYDCAVNELCEETGFKPSQIKIVLDAYEIELVKRDDVLKKQTYLIGVVEERYKDNKITFNPEELKSVQWMSKEEIDKTKLMSQKRKKLIRHGYSVLQNLKGCGTYKLVSGGDIEIKWRESI